MRFLFRSFIILFSSIILFNLSYPKSKEEVKAEIYKLLTNKYLKNTNYSVRILSKDKKETLVSLNQSTLLSPASTIKILTTTTALTKLSKNFKIKTEVLSENNPVNGVIKNNIYVKGFGNPLFSSGDMENLVRELAGKGIRSIDGDIVVDATYFDNKLNRREWIDEKENNDDEGPVSAVTIDFNHLGIIIHSYGKINSTPEVRTFQHILDFKVINNVKVSKINKRRESINLSLKESGNNYTLFVSGRMRPNRTQYYSVRVQNPSLFFGVLFKSMIERRGILVRGNVRIGKTPFKTQELAEHSLFLDSLIRVINKHSDNFCADHLLKILGAELGSKQGSAESGIISIINFLKENNIDTSHYKIFDGSGLSKKNRLTTYALSQMLYNISMNENVFNDFYNSLSIAGFDGTLRHRMGELARPGSVRGKTGTLNNATSLAGYAYAADGELLIYTIFMNDFRRGVYELRKVQDKIISVITEFSGNN